MPSFSIPTLPSPMLINGQYSIPPPSAESFDACFGGFLPERHILTSDLGQTAYYLLSNIPNSTSSPAPSPSSPKNIRLAILMHGGSTPCINMVPLAKSILSSPSCPPTHLLLYDLWGHGLSSTPLLPPIQSLFHTQLISLLATLHWPRAHLVGFSASSAFVVSFAAQYPDLCISISMLAPVGLLHSTSVPTWTRLVRSGGPFGLWNGFARRSILDFVDGGQPPRLPADWRERGERGERGEGIYDMDAVQVWQRENHAGHVAMLVGLYHYGGVYDFHGTYAAVAKGPVGRLAMVVLGEHDAMFGGEAVRRDLQAMAWAGDVVEMGDVGHLIPRQKPEETAVLLGRFWAKCEQEIEA